MVRKAKSRVNLPRVWPFDVFARRSHRRRFNAAVVIMLGTYYFEELDEAARTRIDAEADRVAGQLPSAWPAFGHVRDFGWPWNAAFRSIAMARLRVPLRQGLFWHELLHPWRRSARVRWNWPFGPVLEERQNAVMRDFHFFHETTREAKAYLRSIGLKAPEEDPWGEGDAFRAGLGETGLGERWRRRR